MLGRVPARQFPSLSDLNASVFNVISNNHILQTNIRICDIECFGHMDESDCWQILAPSRSVTDIRLGLIKLCCICTIMN